MGIEALGWRGSPMTPLVILLSYLCVTNAIKVWTENGKQTVSYWSIDNEQKIELQDEILSVLGLEHKPTPKSPGLYSAPHYLLDMYSSLLDNDSGLVKVNGSQPVLFEGEVLSSNSLKAINSSDKIMSFKNQYKRRHSSKNNFRVRHEKDRRFVFDVRNIDPEVEQVMDSELRIYQDSSFSYYPTNWTYTLSIHQVTGIGNDKKRTLKLLDSKIVSLENEFSALSSPEVFANEPHSSHRSGWLMFNVTSALIDWINYPEKNFGLYLRVRCNHFDEDLDPRDIGLVGRKGSKKYQPFLLAFLKNSAPAFSQGRSEKIKSRKSRDVSKKKSSMSSRSQSQSYYEDDDSWNPLSEYHSAARICQKRTLYVSFKDLGWQDWIIAPDGYAAFFCHGECSFPLSPQMNATNHAIVQTLVHLMNPYAVPKPCCAPSKLSAIMVLYFDDNSNVILKKYKNMVVKSCGCH